MKSIVLKLCAIAVLASSLSGCIVYVSPDDEHHGVHIYHHTDKDAPAPNEKPAATVNKTPA